MNLRAFKHLSKRYSELRIAVVGDFCLDRYLEIDPNRKETSIETGLTVRNVINVRSQPGGAGTILSNLSALGVGQMFPVGFCGEDGEGYELQKALGPMPGVVLNHFFATPWRRTFTYAKPIVLREGKSPRELNRLDLKNWTPTPRPIQERLSHSIRELAPAVDALIVLDQSDMAGAGVVTRGVLKALHLVARRHPDLLVIADSRRGLSEFPPVAFKMNRLELAALSRIRRRLNLAEIKSAAAALARKNQQLVFVTAAEQGIVGAAPGGEVEHVPALPVRGEIDVVGAGDAVTANLAAALSAGMTLRESLEIANAAASVVIHKLGTTGTASIPEIRHAWQNHGRTES